MDLFPFASLAHVRVLLLPVGNISRATYDKWATEIRTFENMRLSDIPPGTKDDKARFMPSPKSKGYLHLSFPSHPPPGTHFRMSLFRPSLFPLGVIGIASCSQTDSLSSILAEFNAAIADMFPPGSMFPLAKSCFVFEEGDGTTNLNLGDHLPGLVIIPSMMGNKKENIETLLADLVSNILGEFSVMMQTLESPLGNEYLNANVFPELPSPSDMPRPLVDEPDSVSPLPSFNSQPELARAKSPTSLLKRTSSIGPTGTARQSALVIPPRTPKRQSTIGVSSNAGRMFKVLGDLFLLAGRTEDASIWYTEAIALFKTMPDPLWHGSAQEGLAVVSMLENWSAGQGLQASISNSTQPWAEVQSKLEQAVALYTKAIPSHDIDQQLDLFVFVYVVAILRQCSLLFATWSAKGWGPLAFTAMLHPGPYPYIPPTLLASDQDMYTARERLSTISGISRVQIAGVLAQVHGPWLLHLGHRERINVLEALASMYSFLGYHRKEAYVLREIIGCVMDLIVCGREEPGLGEYSSGYSSSATISNTLSFVRDGDRGAVAIKETDRSDGNESILKLVKYVCRVHGINLEAVGLVSNADTDGEKKVVDADSDEGLMPDPYGWPELQIGILREALAVAEALPDLTATAQIALSALKTLHIVLGEDDQMHFYSISSRSLNIARRRGDKRLIEYWSGQPIVSIELMPPPSTKVLVENPVSVLTPRQERGASILTGAKDPFLYNPRRSLISTKGRTLVVRNESLEFIVTLRNPYIFDLEIQSLTLSTSGVPFESHPIPVVIPSNSYHSVTLAGKPLESGTLVVKGCFVQAPGGAVREFVIPLATQEEEDRRSKRRSTIALESGRSKYAGLDSRPWEKSEKRNSVPQKQSKGGSTALKFVECKVVPEQPLLRIRWSSLTHGAVMLYDGEKSTIRLTLENVSSLPVDFLRLSFEDSTIPPAQQALAEGEMSVFDTYETEYELISRPVFKWDHESEKTDVPPEKKTTVVVQCLGKAGCTSGVINVAYGYIHRPQTSLQEPAEVFHTRRLSYPVLVTVYHMLECHHMNILPYNPLDGLPTSPYGEDGQAELDSAQRPRRRLLLETGNEGEEEGWCLFSVDVRNTYGLPFEITFERVQEGTPPASTTCSVPPGSTTRVIMPVKKFLLPQDVVSQPIPTLSDRQFVVAKTSLTSSEETTQRALFWYREELLKIVRGRWREAGGTRSGDLSLRQQRMSMHMLERLRTETARVKLSMFSRIGDEEAEGSWEEVHRVKDKYKPMPYEFVYLRTQVTNLSPNPLLLMLDLTIDPSEHVIQEGVSSGVPIGRLQSGETKEIETPLCFVACGRFDIVAEVRVAPVRREESSSMVGIGRTTALEWDCRFGYCRKDARTKREGARH